MIKPHVYVNEELRIKSELDIWAYKASLETLETDSENYISILLLLNIAVKDVILHN